jgi:hypothetical protein
MVIISRREKVEVVVLEGGREQDKNRGRKPGLDIPMAVPPSPTDFWTFQCSRKQHCAVLQAVGWSALDAVP